jgi:alkanesulfonate monooxygenase SsuD/methylene tetrahydromethanopterin reductase-like flavin-dependent oxidoreductase (luciferase family)
MTKPTFGWIVHLVARPGASAQALHDENCRFIRRLEGAFDTLWFEDHFQKDSAPTLECWTSLTYLAALFPGYQVGSLVLSQSFRNPALIAKMMATLQVLTAGRLIAGIGAGWKRDEYLAYGYEFPPFHTRAEQLEEAVQILRLMWTRSPATFTGKHYSICAAACEPLPQPPPPLLIGGGGEEVTLRVVAKYADWMNITFADPATYSRKLEILKKHCADAGRDFGAITKSLWAYVSLTRDGVRPPPIRGNRYVIYGTPAAVRAVLQRFVDLGVQHFMLRFMDFPDVRGASLFLDEVLPYLDG